jgi:outer membrane protein assembly factor BamB
MKIHRSNMLTLQLLAAMGLVLTLVLVYWLAFVPQQQTLAGTSAPVPGDDWPTYLHDAQRSAASGEVVLSPSNAERLTRLWSFKTGGGIAASATIVNNTVYIGSWDGYEYALDALKGFLKWKTYLGITTAKCVPPQIGITSSATVQDHVVYVGGGDSYWYALDAYTGAILWKVYTGDTSADKGYYNWASPLIYNGFAYIGIASNCDNPLVSGKLLKVSLNSHRVVGSFSVVNEKEVGGGIWTSPTLDAKTNTIYVTTGTQNQIWQTLSQAIIALDATTLTMKGAWQIPLSQSGSDSDWGNTPILFTDAKGHQMVEATNKNGFTYAFDRANISAGPVWERQTGIGGECPPCGEGSVSSDAFAANTIFRAGGNTTIKGLGYPGAVRALDPATGVYRWEHGVSHPIIPALVYAHGLVIDAEGPTLEVLDAATGSRLYSYETGGDIYGAPSVSHGEIFDSSLDGNVYAFGLGSVPTPIPDPQCPRSWTCQDLGSPRVNGSETFSGGTWNISAGGLGIGGLGSSFDQFRFIYQNAQGDKQLTAQILSQQEVSASSQAGLMMRQNTERGSPFYAAFLTPADKLVVEYRTAFAGAAILAGSIQIANHSRYLEIQRIGDQFQAAVSTDGASYTLVPGSTVTLAMPDKVLEGLFSSSGVNATLRTATFAGVTVGTPGNVPAVQGPATPCPKGWNCDDVGNPVLVGDQSLSNGRWTLKGAGKDIWRAKDQFHFVWQQLSGNSTVSARLVTQEKTDPLAKAGIMLRANTDAGSPYYAVFVTPNAGLTVQYRTIQGLNAQIVTQNKAFTVPTYLRVARWNNIFTTYVSPDGITWTPLDGSSATMNINGAMLGGVVVTSHISSALGSATFDSVSAVDTAVPAPTACPVGWNCADIGYPAPVGSQLFKKGTWTLEGGGFDIYFKVDQFHYVWQSLAGDGSVSARVTAETSINGNEYAKSGVMLRQTTDTSSPYYAALVTPNHGIFIQYRRKQGAGTGELLLPNTYKVPIYLKVGRSGNIFTAYTSEDGVTWTAVPGSSIEINIDGPMLAGLAVTSHNPGSLRVVTFDNVSIQ